MTDIQVSIIFIAFAAWTIIVAASTHLNDDNAWAWYIIGGIVGLVAIICALSIVFKG